MDAIRKRILLFLFGCIPTRILIVLLCRFCPLKYLPLLGYLALIPVFGFFSIYLTNSRKTGVEVFGGKIWWNELRPLHGVLYLLFAIYAIKKKPFAWLILLVDVLFGLTSFMFYHSSQGDFRRIL